MKKQRAFEEAAQEATVKGWVCKTCRRFWGDDQRMARWCCAEDFPCETSGCVGRVDRGLRFCPPCLELRRRERWRDMPQIPWDGKTPLGLYDDDRYFFDADELREFIEEHEGMKLEDLSLVLCVPDPKPRFDIHDFLDMYLAEGHEVEGGEEIEKRVNDWIDENVDQMWVVGKERPTFESVHAEMGADPS